MAGGYGHKPSDIAAINSRLANLQRQIDSIRGAGRIRSSVIQSAALEFRNEDGEEVAILGELQSNLIGFRVENPDPFEVLIDTFYNITDGTSYFIVGNGADAGVWDLDDFQVRAESVAFGSTLPSAPNAFAPPVGHMHVYAEEFHVATPEFGLYDIPNTSNAANLHLGTVGGLWTVARVTSSRRYKTEIEDAHVDPADVLTLPSRTWIDLGDAAAAGKMVPKDPQAPTIDADGQPTEPDLAPFVPPRQIGFIAEEAWERQSLRQFVKTDTDDRPDAFDYDRFAAVALHAVCVDQQKQLDAQAAEIETLKSEMAAIKQALEAKQ